jgi:hypothetical protein
LNKGAYAIIGAQPVSGGNWGGTIPGGGISSPPVPPIVTGGGIGTTQQSTSTAYSRTVTMTAQAYMRLVEQGLMPDTGNQPISFESNVITIDPVPVTPVQPQSIATMPKVAPVVISPISPAEQPEISPARVAPLTTPERPERIAPVVIPTPQPDETPSEPERQPERTTPVVTPETLPVEVPASPGETETEKTTVAPVTEPVIPGEPTPMPVTPPTPQPVISPEPIPDIIPTPVPEQAPEPVPEPVTKPVVPPGSGAKPPPTQSRRFPPARLPDNNLGLIPDSKGRQRSLYGAITWKQGLYWWIILYPYKTQQDILITRTPPKGATVVNGAGSAYKTIQNLTGETPLKLFLDMGAMDVEITAPSRKPGRPGAIKFHRDRHNLTSQQISLKGIRL